MPEPVPPSPFAAPSDAPPEDAVAERVRRLVAGPDAAAPDAVRAATALRALGERVVRTGPDAPSAHGLGALADELEALLARHDDEPLRASRYASGAADEPGGLQPNARGAHPIVGLANPAAPPVHLDAVDGRAVGLVTFTAAQEGFPWCAHGGWIAAVFDMVLGTATAGGPGRGGLTGTLSVRYVGLTPIGVPLRFEGWHDRTEGRKTFVRGSLHRLDRDGPAGLCAEAEAVFITPSGR